jgi:DNA-binding response OmpR family regulator
MARILLIEDEEQVRGLLRETLEQEGYEVIEGSNGTEGLRQYNQHIFDLVIMDVLLPDKDGFEILNELKQHHDQVNVLAISGGIIPGTDNVLQIAQRLGARKALPKPFDLTDFLAVVNQMITFPQSTL